MNVIHGLAGLQAVIGQEYAVSDWHTVTQEQINQFAQATQDFQWIHIDPVKAAAGPFGTTIAHGFLTLSMIAGFAESSFRIEGRKMAVNYGLNKVRFTSPVPVNKRIRARFKLLELKDIDKGVQAISQVTIELEDSDRPACVAESVANSYF
jgi:acyl dehydratase